MLLGVWHIQETNMEPPIRRIIISSRFMNKAKGLSESVLVIMDTTGRVFGAYISCDLHFKSTFYGNGESFLFKLDADQSSAATFGATLDNLFFVYCGSDGVGLGSDPHYGLFLEPEMTRGSTHACKTYANDVLSAVNYFVIQRIELWKVRK